MKKNSLLWTSALLLMLVGLCNCSKDDDYSYVTEFSNNNDKENLIGTWHILQYYSGWGGSEEYEAGEITVTFTKNGEMRVVNKREDQRPFSTGTWTYSFVDIERSISTIESRTCISFGYFFIYSYTFDKGFLYLSQEAYDGDGYTFQKLK